MHCVAWYRSDLPGQTVPMTLLSLFSWWNQVDQVFVDVLPEDCIPVLVHLLAGDSGQRGGGVHGFGEGPMHTVSDDGLAVPISGAYRNFCGALDWFSLSVGGVGVSRGGVEFVPVDAGPVCGRDAVVRFGRRCLFALPQGVGDE